MNQSRSWYQRLTEALGTFDPQPLMPPAPPDLAGLDPLTRAVVLLRWHIASLIYQLSPEGTLTAVVRWCSRLALILAGPLLVVFGILWAVNALMGMLGNLLTSSLGVGLIVLALVLVVLKLGR